MANKPDYILGVMNTQTNEKVPRIGIGYIQADGSIKVMLNRFVQVPNGPEWMLRLFPWKEWEDRPHSNPDNVTPFPGGEHG